MKHTIFSVFLLLLCLPVAAQEHRPDLLPAPLVFFGDELMLMDEVSGEIEVWAECDQGYIPRISPNGEWLALLSADYDLRLCNLYTREVQTVDMLPDTAVSRPYSQAAWSPDGDQVAWLVDDDEGTHVVVYDLETEEVTVLIDELTDYPLQVLWGQSGILVVAQGASSEVATLYSAEGDVLFDDLAGGVGYGQYFWVTDDEGKEYLGVYIDFWSGSIIDLETGFPVFAEAIELYSLLAPEQMSISLYLEGFDWVVSLPDDELLYVPSLGMSFTSFVPYLPFDARNVSISPDGQAFVIFDLARILWRDGSFTDLPAGLPIQDGAGVIWGPMSYRVRGSVFSGQG